MAAQPPADPLGLFARLRSDYSELAPYLVSQAVAAAYEAADALGTGVLTETRLEALSRERLDMLRRRLAPRHARQLPVAGPDPVAVTRESPGARDAGDPAAEPPVNLSLTTRVEDDVTVVAIRGDVDIETAPQLRAHFLELVGSARHHLVVDLDDVGTIDSSGLAVLVGVLKRVRVAGGSLRLAFAHERIHKIFRITGLTHRFSIHARTAEAVAEHRAEQLRKAPAGYTAPAWL